MMPLHFDYFYGSESAQFSFYRIPKALMTDPRYKSVSAEAKILYGLLLDRMGLSIRNDWMDADGKVYIYFTLRNAAEMIGCGRDKAIKLFKELDKEGGIGLIERKKQGMGRPDRIYVKNFILPSDRPPSQTSEIPKSASRKNRSQEVGKSDSNKTEINNTEKNETYLSIPLPPSPTVPLRKTGTDGIDSSGEMMKKIKRRQSK